MAKNETVDKVKSLLDGHCYQPLREAAENWLDKADEKYDVKDKAGKAWDAVNVAVDKISEASETFNEKMTDAGDKFTESVEKASEKAAPVVDKLGDKAAEAKDKIADKATDAKEKIEEKRAAAKEAADNTAEDFATAAEGINEEEKALQDELVAQLKEGINTVDDLLETFGSEDAKEKFGEEFAAKMKAHAEELKAAGEKFCDCDACVKARAILKDFGEDLDAIFDDIKGE